MIAWMSLRGEAKLLCRHSDAEELADIYNGLDMLFAFIDADCEPPPDKTTKKPKSKALDPVCPDPSALGGYYEIKWDEDAQAAFRKN